MTTYDGIDSAIGALRLAAIDAYMASNGWTLGDTEYTHIYTMGSSFADYSYSTVTRPDSAGNGGGDQRRHNWGSDLLHRYGSNHNEFTPEFDSIRSTIDSLLAPLRGMPDPRNLDHLLDVCHDAEAGLWLDADVGIGGTILSEAFDSAKGNMGLLNGAFPAAFEANFLNQLPGTIGALRELALVRYASFAQEQELWQLAPAAVCDLVDKTTIAFTAVAVSDHPKEFALVLKIAGYVAAGTAIAASGGTAAVALVGVASLGIAILKDTLITDPSAESKNVTFTSIFASFQSVAQELDRSITVAEQEIQRNIADNIDGVYANISTYEINNTGLVSDVAYPEVSIDVAAGREITGTYLPNIAQHLRAEATGNGRMYPSTALRRTGDIGCGASGPGAEFVEISALLYKLVEKLATETLRASDALSTWIDDVHGYEESVVDQIADLLAQLDAPTFYDPVQDEPNYQGPFPNSYQEPIATASLKNLMNGGSS